MRIHLKIRSSKKSIPFDHQPLLTGCVHKWIGRNDEHGEVSLYSFSLLDKGIVGEQGLVFPNGTNLFFSAYDPAILKRMISGIQADPAMFNGLEVTDILLQEDPDLHNRKLFYVASPIFIKRMEGDRNVHILFNDPKASVFLKETLITKMNKAGISCDLDGIHFDTSYQKAKSMKITYKGIQNRASWCPVLIEGSHEAKLFAWNVGLGNSTGIGFGAIK